MPRIMARDVEQIPPEILSYPFLLLQPPKIRQFSRQRPFFCRIIARLYLRSNRSDSVG